MALSRFRESVLWRTVCGFSGNHSRRIFLDRDGSVFRHIHHFLLTARLLSSLSDLEVLYEQMEVLGLQLMMEVSCSEGKARVAAKRFNCNAANQKISGRLSGDFLTTFEGTATADRLTAECPGVLPLADICTAALQLWQPFGSLAFCSANDRAVEKLREEEPHLRKQMKPDMSVPEKASISYWKPHKWSSRLSELPVKSCSFSGTQDKAPLGLLENPFLDVQEDVPYCFLPMDMLERYPGLLTDDNLLWFAENFALIECGCWEFRFIGNFLHTGRFFLPEKFSEFNVLEAEIISLGIPGLLKALRAERKSSGYDRNLVTNLVFSNNTAASKGKPYKATKPFYSLALDLLAKYPDSALGQLRIESSVDGSKLYIIGSGTLFLHVKNWLGMYRLPLTRSISEIYGLCTYLDRGDAIYQPMREAVRSYLRSRSGVDGGALCDSWIADVRAFPKHQIVRVYVRSFWYATYLETLLKYPELLQNSRKACWITCGFSLLVNGDGEMFRHILNFLRLGSLYLPSGFTEWSLLCQEVEEFQIPSLLKALHDCKAYRLWVKDRVHGDLSEDPKPEVMSWISSTDLQVERNVHESKTKMSACAERPAAPPPDERNTLKPHTSDRGYLCHHVTCKSSGCRGEMEQEGLTRTGVKQQDGRTRTGVTQVFIPVYDAVRHQSSPMQHNLLLHHDYSKLSQTVTQRSSPTPDGTAVSTERASGLVMDIIGPGDLGAILWVQHHPLLANDGSSTSFQDSILYTTEMDIQWCAEGIVADLLFLTFNMSHKEVLYARQCHSFLTGIILDCIQLGDHKPDVCNVVKLVSMYWASQIPVRQFVDDLMLLKFYNGKENKSRTLQRWLEFSLPYARRYSKCMNMLLQEGHQRSASGITLRTLLQ